MIQPPSGQSGDGDLDLISIGEALFDFVAPDAPQLDSAVTFTKAPGGAPANVAVAAARLGARVAFIGAVGDDPFGHALTRLLGEEGVDTAAMRIVAAPTTLAFVARNSGGIPDFVFYRGADAELRPEDVPRETLRRTFLLYTSSMALMTEPARDTTLYAVEMARELGVRVAIDPNLRPRSWPSLDEAREAILPLIRAADILKINDEEARLLAGTRHVDGAIEDLSNEGALTVVTLGPEGCLWRLDDRHGTVPAPEVNVRDTTGAGDAFMGALLAELALRNYTPGPAGDLDTVSLEGALRIACAAGAYACTRLGAMTSLPTRENLEQLLNC